MPPPEGGGGGERQQNSAAGVGSEGSLSRGDLEALARKYQILGDLRRARERGEGVAPRELLRDLASEFPGALNELDTLPLGEIDRRADRIEAALRGEPPEPWIAWLSGYHALFRAALAIKLLSARAHPLDAERAGQLVARAKSRAGGAALYIDEAFVRGVANPPGGRVNTVVFERLSAVFGEPPAVIQRALFPGLRARAPA